MGKKFFINCDEATTICDKSQYGEASLYDKIRLNIHMIMCKHCRKYTKQNSLMTDLLQKIERKTLRQIYPKTHQQQSFHCYCQ